MDRFPIIITLGGMLLGWIAGDMAVTDPALCPGSAPTDAGSSTARRRPARCSSSPSASTCTAAQPSPSRRPAEGVETR